MIVRSQACSGEPLHPAPRGNVLLLTCMDLRVLDDTVRFMNQDNLANRYDHVIFAGAALGALGGCCDEYAHWRKTFFDHLDAAIKLHGIQNVYILEHRHCGAYHKVFQVAPEFGDSPKEQAAEAQCHRKYADLLAKEIAAWAEPKGITLQVTPFLMDLRGRITPLAKPKKTKKAAS